MCRIDAPFGDMSLNEKSDLTERFVQALDERRVDGQFRSLLLKHFSETRVLEIRDPSKLEEALSFAQLKTSDAEKCAAFLCFNPVAQRLNIELVERHPVVADRIGATARHSEIYEFAKDVARTLYSESPYALYDALKTLGSFSFLTLSYDAFVAVLYGEDFHVSPYLFNDPALLSAGEATRNDMLWGFFDAMARHEDGVGNELDAVYGPKVKNLISAASLQFHAGPPTRGTHAFLRGIEFLRRWIASDAEAGRLRSENDGVFRKIYEEWSNLKSLLKLADSSSTSPYQEASDAAYEWLMDTLIEFQEAFYIHLDLASVSEQEIDLWASRMNAYVVRNSSDLSDIHSISREQRDADELAYLKKLCSQLPPDHVEAWVRSSIRQDISSALKGAENAVLPPREFFGDQSRKWWATEFSNLWKARFQEALCSLDIEKQLIILSGVPRLTGEANGRELRGWWDSLLGSLIEAPEFPVALTPQWTIAAVDRLDNALTVPFIDKSIGLLRSELSDGGEPRHHAQLEELLRQLDFLKPSKALRHQLMLLRSSNMPLADESVSCFKQANDEKGNGWYLPLKDMAKRRFAKTINGKPSVTPEEYQQAEVECYEAFARELVDFCLSRLRLRKGEKPKDGKYDTSQVTEKSPAWRQAYLKALMELGLDPNGKAHKTAFFTKQSDPDESVRAVAKECYRAVRRQTKQNRNIQDLKRAMVAAEWWLLMSQRLELKLDVNYEAALKTRRSLLRNPS